MANRIHLRTIFLHVTKACNLHCAYCYFSANKPLPDEMSTKEFSVLWKDIVNVSPSKVVFTGGEPLLRPDILDLFQGLREADPNHRILRCLNTNGHLITRTLASQLVGLVDEVRVSLDALPEKNDKLRGVGNFDSAIQALETLYAVGFEPKVLVTVTSVTLPDLVELLCLLIDKKISRININEFRPIGRGSKNENWRASSKDVQKAMREAWSRCYPESLTQIEPKSSEGCGNCGVGSFLNIMPNGDVFPCHVLTQREFSCGNLRKDSLVDMCDPTRLLGRLQALDFTELAQSENLLDSLSSSDVCLGDVYNSQIGQLPIWRQKLQT